MLNQRDEGRDWGELAIGKIETVLIAVRRTWLTNLVCCLFSFLNFFNRFLLFLNNRWEKIEDMECALNLVLLFLLSLCSIVGEIRQIIVRCFLFAMEIKVMPQ